MATSEGPDRRPWLPRHSILGRIWYPLLEERRTLAGAMSWIGIAILIGFLVIAAFADGIAPFDPIVIQDEKDVPPWTEKLVVTNATSINWREGSTNRWRSVIEAQEVDGVGMTSGAAGDWVNFTSFFLPVYRDSIEALSFVVWFVPNATDVDHYVRVNVSVDTGRTWVAYDVRPATQAVQVDLFPIRTWRPADLSRDVFRLNVTHLSDGAATGNVSVDYIGVEVAWRSHWHLMGTDTVGRDVFTRVLFGTRTSLIIMAIGVFVALAVGFPLGLYSGYVGGTVDKILVLVMDSLYSFPGLLFAGLIAVLLGKGVVNIGLAVTVIYIPLYFRVTRSQVLSAREELYVEAARAIGAPTRRVMFRYIAANVLVAIPVIFSISAADAILTAAGLSYLGLGVEAPTPDWGLDLSAAAGVIDNGLWWASFFPGLVIVILTVGLSFLGEGLNDIINPLLKKERS